MRNQKSDIAGILLGLMLLAGLGQTYADPPLGFDTADNPFNSWYDYDPSSGAILCTSGSSCNLYDFDGVTGATGTCYSHPAGLTGDTDGDGLLPMIDTFFAGGVVDGGCIVLEDWDQDGTCDHRVYDHTRDQGNTDYEPVNFYHQYIGGGTWSRIVAPSPCVGWVGV